MPKSAEIIPAMTPTSTPLFDPEKSLDKPTAIIIGNDDKTNNAPKMKTNTRLLLNSANNIGTKTISMIVQTKMSSRY